MAFTQTVSDKQEDGTFMFQCSYPCGFRSTQWPTAQLAQLRASQHQNEHENGEVMPSAAQILYEAGLGPEPVLLDNDAEIIRTAKTEDED